MLKVVVDSREKMPLHFSDAVQTVRAALPVADYSLFGLEDQIAIERKSLPDLLGCIGRDRERFVRELRQLRAFRFAAIVVEARWPDLMTGMWGVPSPISPNAVIGSLMSFTVKYGVQVILADDHQTAAVLVERLLGTYARMVERDARALAGAVADPLQTEGGR